MSYLAIGGTAGGGSGGGGVAIGYTQAEIDAIMRGHTQAVIGGGFGSMAGIGPAANVGNYNSWSRTDQQAYSSAQNALFMWSVARHDPVNNMAGQSQEMRGYFNDQTGEWRLPRPIIAGSGGGNGMSTAELYASESARIAALGYHWSISGK